MKSLAGRSKRPGSTSLKPASLSGGGITLAKTRPSSSLAHSTPRFSVGRHRRQAASLPPISSGAAEEEIEGPLERLFRIALAAEEIGLQRVVVDDARHAIELALVGDRIDSLRRREGGDDMDLVLENQLLCDFEARFGLDWLSLTTISSGCMVPLILIELLVDFLA